MLSYSPLSWSFHSSPSVGFQKDHVTLPHPLFAKHPAFSTSTLFYCVFSKYLNTYYAHYLPVHSNSISHFIVLCLLMLFLTWLKISQCKQWVHCVRADLVCPWCWLLCLRESPWWIEIPSCVQADVSTHSPSLCFDSLQTTVVFGFVCCPSSSSPSSKESKCRDKE